MLLHLLSVLESNEFCKFRRDGYHTIVKECRLISAMRQVDDFETYTLICID